MGPGGSVIRQLELSTGVRLTIPSRDAPSDEVIMSGSSEALQAAHAAIQTILGYCVSAQERHVWTLGVHESLLGRLIGPRGDTVRELTRQSGALINAPRRGEAGAAVTLDGPAECVEAAYRLICELLHVAPDVLDRQPPLGEDAMQTDPLRDASQQPALDSYAPGAIAEVLFFSPLDEAFSMHSMERFLAFLSAARTSICACVFTLTEPRILAILVAAEHHGLAVRLITDDETRTNDGSAIPALLAAGIPVRVDTTPALMHHKFCVLDGCLAMTGSFNWTTQAATRNNENVLVTNQPELVHAYAEHFEALWQAYDTTYSHPAMQA